MNKTLKTDQAIISLLKLVRVDRIICDTDKGLLKLCLRKGESNYYFTLDATELNKETNKELMELLFPPFTAPAPLVPIIPVATVETLKSLNPNKTREVKLMDLLFPPQPVIIKAGTTSEPKIGFPDISTTDTFTPIDKVKKPKGRPKKVNGKSQ